jgi:hypothetical protein
MQHWILDDETVPMIRIQLHKYDFNNIKELVYVLLNINFYSLNKINIRILNF